MTKTVYMKVTLLSRRNTQSKYSRVVCDSKTTLYGSTIAVDISGDG